MHKNNEITEGGASNVFFVLNNIICTPSLSKNILPGITRELLITEIKKNGISVEEGTYSVENLLEAESVWLTSSTKGLAQVSEIINQKTRIKKNNKIFNQCKSIFDRAFLSSC
tara:strand:- start:1220 stop:1558 length:339 start_codon:yes stop_codon:yes gene_type:complete